ncbi:Type II secretion system protein F [Planctomycetes bacterium K23_9]|uniref:Type II secretion system protein F n=2 Tax=Stieleria marina TaxID=1930275 RepID=A0A517NPM6_9BACT|nr:Type II secretion system protein F [Planctomycetes bacterium K23_9]
MGLAAAATFCRRLGISLKAGADLLAVLDSESKHGPKKHREAMQMLRQGAKEGRQLSETMKSRDKYFPPLLISMTRVGEATGRIERTLLTLADHYDQQLKLRRSFVSSIIWPGIQLFGGIAAISLLIWIMGILRPATGGQMTDILGFGLRGPKGVLIFWAYIGGFFAIIGALIWGFKNNIGGSQNIIPLFYMVPVVGPAIQTITLARFSWTLALSLDAGLDPIRSIGLALDSTDSDYYRAGTEDAKLSIRDQGATLAGGLEATDIFPDEYIARIEMAELSGTDAESTEGLAREYDERAKIAMKTISGFATGVVWMTVGGALIFIIFRMIMTIAGEYSKALEGL